LSDAWLSLGTSKISLSNLSLGATAHKEDTQDHEGQTTESKNLTIAWLLAETSVRDATQANNPNILARALNTSGNVWVVRAQLSQTLANYRESIRAATDAYIRSKQFAEKAGDTALAIKASLNRLNVVVMNDERSPVELLNTLDDLRQRISSLPNTHDKARYLLSLGIFAQNVLQDDKFLKQEQQVTKGMLQEHGCRVTNLDTMTFYPVEEDLGLYTCQQPNGQEISQESIILLTEKDQESTRNLLKKKGLSTYNRQRVLSQTYFAFQNAMRVARNLQDTQTLSIAYGYLGGLYEEEQRYDDALRLTRQAIFFATQSRQSYSSQRHVASAVQVQVPMLSHISHRLYRWYWQKGRILKAQGKRDQAIAAYGLASVNLKPIQQLLDAGYRLPPNLFEKVVKPVQYGLADLLLQKAEDTSEVQEQQSLIRYGIDTVEMVKLAELQDYFQDDCVTALHAKTVSILDYHKMSSQLQREMQHTAILYPVPLDSRLVVLISVGGKTYQHELQVTSDELNETALKLRANLQTRPHNRFLLQSQQLYQWLIAPFEKLLADNQVDTLVVVPDGNLRMIPFSTLHDGKHFLIEKYALSITPGLTLVNPKPVNWNESKILLVGLSEAVQDHSALPNVPKELENIKKIAGNIPSKRILNKDYSFKNFRTEIKQNEYSIIHIATHGEFEGDPAHTYLLTYHEKMRMDDLQHAIGLSRFRDKQIELLTLSACKTAVGDDKAALGLAGVAVKAGARSAIATLWYVDDEATSIAISEFYQQLFLNPGFSKAKALQETQKKLIKIKRYWHPSYWGPFLLIGNWL
jgi:CHAT domain-containing protein